MGRDDRSDAAHPSPRRHRRDDEPVLPSVTRDERGESWGDDPDERSDDWYQRERPPHHA